MRREEVDCEADNVKSIEKGYDPLEDGGNVVLVCLIGGSKGGCKANLGYDKEQFHPERSSKDGMLSVMYTKDAGTASKRILR